MNKIVFSINIILLSTIATFWYFLIWKFETTEGKQEVFYEDENKAKKCSKKIIINDDLSIDINTHRAKSLYKSILENKKYINLHLDKLWNKYTKEIWKNYINKTSCENLKSENPFIKKTITWYNKTDLKKFIWCKTYSDKERQIDSLINTSYEEYREVNIWWWLSTLENKVWNKWEEISIYDYIKQFRWYIEWRATVWWEEVRIWWGWICWVSTAAYQVFAESVDLDILERHNHSILSIDAFGKPGFDSSIFWDWENAELDLKAKNNHWKIFIDTISEANKDNDSYKYWMKLYSWKPFRKYDISFSEEYENWYRTCVDKILSFEGEEKRIDSCYVQIKDKYES